jgi:hypothetical protein
MTTRRRTTTVLAALCGTILVPATALAQEMTWVRHGKFLSVPYDECMARAELALKGQGLKVQSNQTGMVLARKGGQLAAIACGATIDTRMDVSVVVVTNGPQQAALELREALNSDMSKSSCRATPWGFQYCYGKAAEK